MFHVMFVTPQFKTGGGNRVFVELANELSSKGHKVDIIFPSNSDRINTLSLNKDINIRAIGRYRKGMARKITNLFRLVYYVNRNGHGARIVISDPIICILIPFLGKKEVYRYVQGDDYELFDDRFLIKNKIILKILKFFIRLSFKYRVLYLFNSKFTYNKFIERSKRSDVREVIVHPALNSSVFYNKNIREPGRVNLCLTGRRHPFKGLDDFLRVWRNDKNGLRSLISRVYVISDEELSRFDLSGLEVIIPRDDHEIADVYNKSHVFISTSWKEGFCLPPLEAMACGCSVILSDCGGVNEYAVPGENCLMYEPRQEALLTNALKSLLGSPCLREKLAAAAQKRAKSFSWAVSADNLIDIMGEV